MTAVRPPEQAPDPGQKRPAASFWRPVVFGIGWVCLVIGVAGIFLPLVPGTLFLILAAACFTRSSPRFESWLLDHPRFGPPVRQWRDRGAIPRRAKIYAGVSLAASWLLILTTASPQPVKIACLVIFVAVGVFIGTRPHA
jgi:hypothetical protein